MKKGKIVLLILVLILAVATISLSPCPKSSPPFSREALQKPKPRQIPLFMN